MAVARIAVTGPESTGKSWLTRHLAAHYNTLFVPEYAREYVDGLRRPYRRKDILVIAREQLARENAAETAAAGLLFCDTELIVAKIWEQYRYDSLHPWIERQIRKNRYDLYLLCNIDLPWEPDPQREYPHLRKFFFDWFRRELEGYGFPYHVISGDHEERLRNAVAVVDRFLKASAK